MVAQSKVETALREIYPDCYTAGELAIVLGLGTSDSARRAVLRACQRALKYGTIERYEITNPIGERMTPMTLWGAVVEG